MPDAKHVYVQSLQNTHAAEAQGLQQVELQLKGLDDYPEYAAMLRDHAGQTRRQLSRIESALEEAGSGRPTLREVVTGAVGTAGAAVHAVMPDATLKNLYAGCAFQGEMIAAYTSLVTIARAAGYATDWIETAIEEEKASADAALKLVGTVTERFLAKQAA